MVPDRVVPIAASSMKNYFPSHTNQLGIGGTCLKSHPSGDRGRGHELEANLGYTENLKLSCATSQGPVSKKKKYYNHPQNVCH